MCRLGTVKYEIMGFEYYESLQKSRFRDIIYLSLNERKCFYMKTVAEKRLFWFLKDGTELDLSNIAHLDMYAQQTLSRGRSSDVKRLLKIVKPLEFFESFSRIKNFLPKEVKAFWEEELGDINKPAEKDTQPRL